MPVIRLKPDFRCAATQQKADEVQMDEIRDSVVICYFFPSFLM
jgi:hypothetical protein